MDLIERLIDFIMYEDSDDSGEILDGDTDTKAEALEKLKKIKEKKDIIDDVSKNGPEIPVPPVTIHASGKAWKTSRFTDLESGIEIVRPKHIEERVGVVDSMKSRRSIVVNLECLEHEDARRFFDYICGAAYALDVAVQRVANWVYLFSPSGIEVTYKK